MQLKNDYISVAEAAEKLGITKQAVYGKIKTVWKEYTINSDGKMYIDKCVLESDLQNQKKKIFSNDIIEQLLNSKEEQISILKEQIEYLKSENQKLHQLLDQQQQLQGQLQQKLLLEESVGSDEPEEQEQKVKKGFFAKFKKNKE